MSPAIPMQREEDVETVMTSTLASASASMHPTVSPTSSDDSDFSVASLGPALPEAASSAANVQGEGQRDEGYNEDPVSRAL